MIKVTDIAYGNAFTRCNIEHVRWPYATASQSK